MVGSSRLFLSGPTARQRLARFSCDVRLLPIFGALNVWYLVVIAAQGESGSLWRQAAFARLLLRDEKAPRILLPLPAPLHETRAVHPDEWCGKRRLFVVMPVAGVGVFVPGLQLGPGQLHLQRPQPRSLLA